MFKTIETMKVKLDPLPQPILEGISKAIGDTEKGLSGSQIEYLLQQALLNNITPGITKWQRIYNAFIDFQNREQCSNNIFTFIKLALSPSRYVNEPERFEWLLKNTNQQLSFAGWKIGEDGKQLKIQKATTIQEAQIKARNLKSEIENRNGHAEIIKYCKAELLSDNYFHAVFEACKGLFERIRDLSGVNKDGIRLIEEVFSTNPILIINNYLSNSEKDEHSGFCNLLKGLCGMFRNTEAHEPKVSWTITEQDALEILGVISYCHRRLDSAQKIR